MFVKQHPVSENNHNPVMDTLAKRIELAREQKGWTQTELAKRAGIRQSFISALETGTQKNSGWLPEIAYALGVHAYWLKTGKGDKMISSAGAQLHADDEKILRALPLLDPALKKAVIGWAEEAIAAAAEKPKRA